MQTPLSKDRINQESWKSCFLHTPGADYFKQLDRPHEINYLDYLKSCQAHSRDRVFYDTVWQNMVLPSLRDSERQILKQECSRLEKEWRQSTTQRMDYWTQLQEAEIEKDNTLLNSKRMHHLRRNAVKQLNMTVEDYTRKTAVELCAADAQGAGETESETRAEETITHPTPVDTNDQTNDVPHVRVGLCEEHTRNSSDALVAHASSDSDKSHQSGNISQTERDELLSSVERARHTTCNDWIIQGRCAACLFEKYQLSCIDALTSGDIRICNIADTMAVIGVFAPSLATPRMKRVFKSSMLGELTKTPRLPKSDIDSAAVLDAIQLRINDMQEEADQALLPLPRKLRIMFQTLLDQLSFEEDGTISESTFVTNYVAHVLHGTLGHSNLSVEFPNTESQEQRDMNMRADRPDLCIKRDSDELLYGEITGPRQKNNDAKNKWDMYRLIRFGKTLLDKGKSMAPLVQVIHGTGTYMRLVFKVRGVYLLEKVGHFIVPTTIANISSLLATLPTMIAAKADLEKMLDDDKESLKRSWGYGDIDNIKRRMLSKPKEQVASADE